MIAPSANAPIGITVRAERSDVLILGAGAAGLMAAIEAGRRGLRVCVLERAERPGKKILISGGGRCNFTNLHTRPDNFLSANPHFAKSALARYTPADFISLVERHGIAYHEKTLGQLFCDGSAQQIVDLLMAECSVANVRLVTGADVNEIQRNDATGKFTVAAGCAKYVARALIVATGGLSIPKMGATGFGYDVARQFGVPIEPCRPALVPLTLASEELAQYSDLTGISAPVVVSAGKRRFREKMLFTHRGLSGPAVLQISSYWKKPGAVQIDWAENCELLASLREPNARRDASAMKVALRAVLSARLADRLVDVVSPAHWTNHALDELERRLHAWTFLISGTEGYEKAEVTAGGVSTNALSAQTMECRAVPGLYFIGEVVDVTGHLGGFNFQWAWASGAAAGRNAGSRE
ncbi:MAG TPA: aminoacetone oxidase family FAD-binding enzyme [Terracidiphilus sp.]|nr:aminoacetone oxidase family FAD-binding enzyme [Terracidiphilus sp.]